MKEYNARLRQSIVSNQRRPQAARAAMFVDGESCEPITPASSSNKQLVEQLQRVGLAVGPLNTPLVHVMALPSTTIAPAMNALRTHEKVMQIV